MTVNLSQREAADASWDSARDAADASWDSARVSARDADETSIAFSDEFEFVEDSSGMVHIMDGEQTVRLSIPRDILNDLVMQIHRRVDTHF